MICVWHFSDKVRVFYHGYLGVEFFFILSGALLMKSVKRHPETGALDYTINKFLRFFPKYVVSLIPIFALVNYMWAKDLSFNTIVDIVFRFISECFMVQNVGIFHGGANYPLWYLCVLLYGGGLIYSIIRNSRKWALGVILPLFVIFGYSYIFSNHNCCIERWGNNDGIYLPFVRGIADMSLGVLLMAFISRKRSLLCNHLLLINMMSICGLCGIIVQSLIEPSYDQYVLIFLPFLLMACFLDNTIFNRLFSHKIWEVLGSLSFEMFLIHAFIAKCFSHTIMHILSTPWLIVCCYLTTVIISAYLFKRIFICWR
jgi:peptidoglycan/LPS O-acetylase OafA/YrhL